MNIKDIVGKYGNLRADCVICRICGFGDLETYRGYDADGVSSRDFPEDPKEPLTIFFRAPSFGEQKVKPRESALIADRLEQLLPQIESDEYAKNVPDISEYVNKLIDGFRKAASRNEDVHFD